MKTQIHTKFVIASSLAVALLVWFPVQARSAEPADGKMTYGKMAQCCQKMKAQKLKMMADMKAQDSALTAQVSKMNGAPEDKKLDLLAAVVTKMVEQRTTMIASMEKMHEKMMQHKLGGKESMSQCQMMKGMAEKAGNTQKPQN
ncbi:MAG: hypothetical protein WCS65_01520 [Verrucomicrobiae bacterium]